MANSKKKLHEELRNRYTALVTDFLSKSGEEILQVGSNEFAIPCVDSEGNDEYMVITFKVPTGSRDGEAYDGYALAEDFKMKTEAKAEKAKETARKKAEKIERDKASREAKAKAKAKKEE